MAGQLLQSFSSLETMVSKPTWKDILLELMASNRFDPWNVNITEIADAFINKVRHMEEMNFGLQANVILAASILLKYKSNSLAYLNAQQAELTDFIPEGEEPIDPDAIPQLTLSSRILPKRQVTFDELVAEMERVIKYENMERVRVPRGAIVDTIDLELPERNIEADLQMIMEKIDQNSDGDGWSLFSSLVRGLNFQQIVYTLLCVLHLVQMDTIDIRQDKLFGEIFIHRNARS